MKKNKRIKSALGSKVQELLLEAVQINQRLAKLKPLYGRMDQLITMLVNAGFEGAIVNGKKVSLVDNFFDHKTGEFKNVAWKSTAAKRFDLEIA